MPLEFQYYAQFGVFGPYPRWNGANHADIVDWINSGDPTRTQWSISSVTATELVLSPNYSKYGDRVFALNDWIGRFSLPTPLDGAPGGGYEPREVILEGGWATPDPGGRPASIDELIYDPPA
jgi:hypothetical protein